MLTCGNVRGHFRCIVKMSPVARGTFFSPVFLSLADTGEALGPYVVAKVANVHPVNPT